MILLCLNQHAEFMCKNIFYEQMEKKYDTFNYFKAYILNLQQYSV